MTKIGRIVGFYFAKDKMIHRSFDIETQRYTDVDHTQDAIDDGTDSLYKAAQIIKGKYSYNGAPIVGVGLAVPTSIVDLNPDSDAYGELGGHLTPRNWQGINAKSTLLHALQELGSPLSEPAKVGIISQVGAMAKGHFRQYIGSPISRPSSPLSKDKRSNLYIVADEGIGVASYNAGWLLHGSAVPNIGHFMVVPLAGDKQKPCKVHHKRPCLNAFASLNAIHHRFPHIDTAEKFIDCQDHNIIANVAHYIAQAVSNLVLFMSPQKIILGGRIAQNPHFRGHFVENLSSLLHTDQDFDEFSYPEFSAMWSMVELQKDKNFGVNGAILTALEHVEKSSPVTDMEVFR